MKARVLVTGGAGYVGSALVPRLLELGYGVRVLDLFWYGHNVFPDCADHPNLALIEGDIRDPETVQEAVASVDSVIHLACISNDPSFELDPALGKSINLDAFPGLVQAAQTAGVQRFIYASSSSIYGVKDEPDVREDAPPEPLTDYSRYKLECEHFLLAAGGDMVPVILRPATVCGYAPRLRLDLTVNILTAHALERGVIRVFGGSQLRPNLHIRDMVAAYELFLEAPDDKVRGEAFNVGFENHAVGDIAEKVRTTLGNRKIEIRTEANDDLRSYHVNADKVRRVLGFKPRHTLEDAIFEIAEAFEAGRMTNPLANPAFHNIRRMREIVGAVPPA